MSEIEYIKFSDVNPDDLIRVLNNRKIREHLVDHDLFDAASIKEWINSKIKVDAIDGCKVRAIHASNQLIGWCGIQLENENYEIAIVIDNHYWGLGKNIFYDIVQWAKALGHEEIFIHFLHSRPEYKFLRKISENVYESEILGSKFRTYQIAINRV